MESIDATEANIRYILDGYILIDCCGCWCYLLAFNDHLLASGVMVVSFLLSLVSIDWSIHLISYPENLQVTNVLTGATNFHTARPFAITQWSQNREMPGWNTGSSINIRRHPHQEQQHHVRHHHQQHHVKHHSHPAQSFNKNKNTDMQTMQRGEGHGVDRIMVLIDENVLPLLMMIEDCWYQ